MNFVFKPVGSTGNNIIDPGWFVLEGRSKLAKFANSDFKNSLKTHSELVRLALFYFSVPSLNQEWGLQHSWNLPGLYFVPGRFVLCPSSNSLKLADFRNKMRLKNKE